MLSLSFWSSSRCQQELTLFSFQVGVPEGAYFRKGQSRAGILAPEFTTHVALNKLLNPSELWFSHRKGE